MFIKEESRNASAIKLSNPYCLCTKSSILYVLVYMYFSDIFVTGMLCCNPYTIHVYVILTLFIIITYDCWKLLVSGDCLSTHFRKNLFGLKRIGVRT